MTGEYKYDGVSSAVKPLIRLENGFGVCSGYEFNYNFNFTYTLYSCNETGEMTELGNSPEKFNTGIYSEGLFFCNINNEAGFYDINFNKTIDLSEYDYAIDNDNIIIPLFSDGYCLLRIRNPQGSLYFTVIDKNGERMFEPIKCNSSIGGISCGLIKKHEDGITSFINTSGETVIELRTIDDIRIMEVTDFNDDVARVSAEDGESGIFVYYIDKTGKRLF
jgi:hypothetical protein